MQQLLVAGHGCKGHGEWGQGEMKAVGVEREQQVICWRAALVLVRIACSRMG